MKEKLNDELGSEADQNQFETIVALAQCRSQKNANKPFIQWLDRGNVEGKSYTYSEMDSYARALAVHINQTLDKNKHQENCSRQKVALIITQPGLDFVVSFFACLYAGVIAVPTYPPKKNESLDKFRLLIADAEAKVIITDETTLHLVKDLKNNNPRLDMILASKVDTALSSLWEYPRINKNSTAFYQYTSGSTGSPKGVVVSHDNLMVNQQMIASAMNHDANAIVVGWLPMFHDMGLIGNLLQPFYLGARCILMSPSAFIMNPIRWLEAISKYKATISGGPNFAYDLCIRRTTERQRANLDLSRWTIAFNGSEPVRAESIQQFTNTFKQYGFKQSAMYPCYGMAESTLFISGSSPIRIPNVLTINKQAFEKKSIELDSKQNESIDESIEIVSSGRPILDACLKIVDPATNLELDENSVGEIWVNSRSNARSYNQKSRLSKLTFDAKIRNDLKKTSYLKTGDLGFLHDGELYVTGRIKDLIILNGKNYYPQDIEKNCLEVDGILSECTSVAFSIDKNGKEQAVVILAVKKNIRHKIDYFSIWKSIKSAVIKFHGIKLYDLIMVSARLPLTSSGKIRRSKCREMYLNNDFIPIFRNANVIPLTSESTSIEKETINENRSSHC